MAVGSEIEGHISRAFDGELSSLHVQVVEMGGLVLLQVREATTAYADWDASAAGRVLERERQVNEFADEIDVRSLRLIAKRQPVAGDLRVVLGLAKVVAEFERMGDEAKKISLTVLGRAGRTAARPGAATSRDVRHLATLAINMVRLSLDALDCIDVGRSAEVIALDHDLDGEYADGLRRLMTRAMEDPRNFSAALEAAFVSKSLERIGDHARDVARLVGSMGQGRSPPPRFSPCPAAAR
ncbi:MAG: phosphate signaling complex protein PhoU [Sinobacteraceae bacterium]|nr:phosphate signaling complex protein PhoU [Nevskiaceae bacterium]